MPAAGAESAAATKGKGARVSGVNRLAGRLAGSSGRLALATLAGNAMLALHT